MFGSDDRRSAIFASRRAFLCSLGGLFAARLRLDAQQPSFATDVNVVSLFATVRDKKGHIIKDLEKSDFTLEDEGKPQTIRYFSRESDLPLTLGLLVDTSLSQRRLIEQERTASLHFFNQVLRENKDQAFVIHFDREIELLQDVTGSRKELEQALQGTGATEPGPLRPGGPAGEGRRRGGRFHGGTCLYDAIYLAADEVTRKQKGRKALVVLSDGVDTASHYTLETSIEKAQRSDTMVYAILFSDREAYRDLGGFGGRRGRGRGGPLPGEHRPDGKKALRKIAAETGGELYEVSKKETLETIYDRIQEVLRNQYSLGFTPEPAATEGYHQIRLATTRRDLTVQTREGYFARQ